MTNATGIVSGLIIAGYLVIGTFFLRFRKESSDRLFAFFAAAFYLLALQRLLLVTLPATETVTIGLYGVRAFAFGVILYAILDKNRKS